MQPRLDSPQLPRTTETPLMDPRFGRLLGREAWTALPDAVRRRFGKRVGPGETVVYVGRIRHTRMNLAGRILAQLLRLVGAPLPLDCGNADMPALVSVTEDAHGNGQFWTRQYGRPGRRGGRGHFPQVFHSTKCFRGPTGCEEWVTHHLGMALRVTEEDGHLVFTSERYLFRLLGRTLPIPRILEPGRLRVAHEDRGLDGFHFELTLTHPLFGRLLDQGIDFKDG